MTDRHPTTGEFIEGAIMTQPIQGQGTLGGASGQGRSGQPGPDELTNNNIGTAFGDQSPRVQGPKLPQTDVVVKRTNF
jgi:hypothetical protein